MGLFWFVACYDWASIIVRQKYSLFLVNHYTNCLGAPNVEILGWPISLDIHSDQAWETMCSSVFLQCFFLDAKKTNKQKDKKIYARNQS